MPAARRKRAIAWFGVLLAVFVVTRLVLLLTSDQLYHDEEEFRGTVALELIQGARFDLFDYQYTAYEGGSLVADLLVVPFYLLFGPSVYGLKAAGLVIACGIFATVFLLLRRYAGRRAAVIGSVLVILGPPYFQRRTLMTMGDFELSMLAGLLVLAAFSRVFLAGRNRPRDLALFGVLSGLAVWVHYSSAVMVAVCGFLLLFRLRAIGIRGVLFAVAGAVVGAVPLIYYNLAYAGAGLFRVGEANNYATGLSIALRAVWHKAVLLAVVQLPASYQFKGMGPATEPVLAYLYFAGFCVAVIVALVLVARGYRRSEGEDRTRLGLCLAALVYLAAYTLAYTLSGYSYEIDWSIDTPQSASYLFHFCVPLFLCVPLAVDGLARMGGRGGKVVMGFLLLLVLPVGALGYAGLIDAAPGDPDRRIGEPFSTAHLAYMLGENFYANDARARAVYAGLTPAERRPFVRGMGMKRGNFDTREVPDYLDPAERAYFLFGYGRAYWTDAIARDRQGGTIDERLEGWAPIDRVNYLEGVWDAAADDPNLTAYAPDLMVDLLIPKERLDDERNRLIALLRLDLWDRYPVASARTVDEAQAGAFTIETVHIDLPPVSAIPLRVYRPTEETGRLPAVLVVHDQGTETTAFGKDDPAASRLCADLSSSGVMCVAYDRIGYGDRAGTSVEPEAVLAAQIGLPHLGLEVWEARHVFNYTASRADVDAGRVGVAGLGGGGSVALLLAAIEPRIDTTSSLLGTTSTAMLRLVAPAHGWAELFGGMSTSLDVADVLALIAPRPVHMVAATRDALFPFEGVRRIAAKGALYYCHQHYACQRISLQTVNAEHLYTPEAIRAAAGHFFREFGVGDAADSTGEPAAARDTRGLTTGGQLSGARRLRDAYRAVLPQFASPATDADLVARRDAVRGRSLGFYTPNPPALSQTGICAQYDQESTAERMKKEIRAPDRNSRQALILLVGRLTPQNREERIADMLALGYSIWVPEEGVPAEVNEQRFFDAKGALMDGVSPVGWRIDELTAAICTANEHPDLRFPNVYLWALDWDAVPAVVAASLSQGLRGVILESAPTTLAEQLDYDDYPLDIYRIPFFLPGIYPEFDLVDLIAPFAPQDLFVTRSFTADSPAIAERFEANAKRLAAFYNALGRPENLHVGPNDFSAILEGMDAWH